ncbi:VanZ family protein [Tenacibaculum sp. M341]|uniref:VanZ family protein n=1 Tax=Tenacibaculum sp. M341 TaxID=2530339 RepID=UPI001FB4AC5D|nr:VanZ family protein [Tenacibaculum sp. M341]
MKHNAIYLAVFVTIAITLLSLLKLGKQPMNFTHSDKVKHAFAYFTLTFLWLCSFKSKFTLYIVLLCVLFGVLMEYLQGTITTYRTFDYADMLANTIGALLAYFLMLLLKKSSNMLNSL